MVTSKEGFNFFKVRAAKAPHPEHPMTTILFGCFCIFFLSVFNPYADNSFY